MKIQSKRSFRYPPAKVKFQSLKLGKTILCNSKLESDFALLLEFDEDVLSYQIRSFSIYYKAEGNNKKITPHFLIQKADNPQTAVWLNGSARKQVQEKQHFRLIRNVCFDHGIHFEITDEAEIRRQPRLNNYKLLWRFSRVEIGTSQILQCSDFFESNPIPVFNDLLAYFKSKNLSYGLAFSLLFRKVIDFDINSFSLSESTPLYLGKNFPFSAQNAQSFSPTELERSFAK